MELTKPYPTYDDCCLLWKTYHTPDHVIGHCKAVSNTATIIAQALNQHGYQLNIPLITSAGLLHDLLRVEDEHWEKASHVMLDLGYVDIAAIIRVHMNYHRNSENREITETDLVCFGDRIVKEDKFVGLSVRMDYIIEKSRHYHSDAELRIRKSFAETERFKEMMETIIGKKIEELDGLV